MHYAWLENPFLTSIDLLCFFHSFGPPFWSKQITAVIALNLSSSCAGDLQTLQTPSYTDTIQSLKQCIIYSTPTKAKVKGWQQDTEIKAVSEKELRTGNQRERNLTVWRLWGAACRLNLLPILGKRCWYLHPLTAVSYLTDGQPKTSSSTDNIKRDEIAENVFTLNVKFLIVLR